MRGAKEVCKERQSSSSSAALSPGTASEERVKRKRRSNWRSGAVAMASSSARENQRSSVLFRSTCRSPAPSAMQQRKKKLTERYMGPRRQPLYMVDGCDE